MRDVTCPRIPDSVAHELHETARLLLVSYNRILESVRNGYGSSWKFDNESGYLCIETTGITSLSPTIPGTVFVAAKMNGDRGTVSVHVKDRQGKLDSQQDITVVVLQKDHLYDEYVDWITRTNALKSSYLSYQALTNMLKHLIESTLSWSMRG